MTQPGFFDLADRHRKLTDSGDPLVRLAQAVPWELWRPLLERVHEKERKSKAGRPAWDVVLIWKLLVLQALYNLSDDQLEYQLRDRLSFMRFVGLSLEDRVPDAKTIWLYRERLQELGLMAELCGRFEDYLREHGYAAKKGQIIDAAIVPVPTQRNRRAENAAVRAGQTPEEWAEQPAKLRQKDIQARWTQKNGRAW
jgi:IS5 family transposase